jgi:hypothetical protein
MFLVRRIRWLAAVSRCLAAVAVVGLAAFTGCGQTPQIASYTVEKDVPDRMLGAILVLDDRCWFFKLTGPREDLERKKGDFESFLKSVEIGDEAPQWQLPDGWELDNKKPNQMRFATIKVPLESKAAELSVSFLPMQGSEQQFLAANINRWRDQMGQGRLSARDLKSMSQVETKSGPAYVVNIPGKLKGGGMAGPFAGRG